MQKRIMQNYSHLNLFLMLSICMKLTLTVKHIAFKPMGYFTHFEIVLKKIINNINRYDKFVI